MPNKTDKNSRLATALQFANLGLEQNAGADRAHAQRVASAIQLMGLLNQQQENFAQQAHAAQLLGLQQTGQADEIRHRGAMEQQGQANNDFANWQATDASQRAWDANASLEKNRVATEDHQRRTEGLGAFEALLRSGSDPQKSSMVLPQDMQAPFIQQHNDAMNAEVAKYLGVLAPIKDPAMQHQIISSSAAHPDVKAQVIAQLGRPSMPTEQVLITPSNLEGRAGGPLSPIGMFLQHHFQNPFSRSNRAESQVKAAKINEALLSALYGAKVQPQPQY